MKLVQKQVWNTSYSFSFASDGNLEKMLKLLININYKLHRLCSASWLLWTFAERYRWAACVVHGCICFTDSVIQEDRIFIASNSPLHHPRCQCELWEFSSITDHFLFIFSHHQRISVKGIDTKSFLDYQNSNFLQIQVLDQQFPSWIDHVSWLCYPYWFVRAIQNWIWCSSSCSVVWMHGAFGRCCRTCPWRQAAVHWCK